VATRKPQSLAEHSFNVAHIGMAICKLLPAPANWYGEVAKVALIHDIDEVLTGDMPTPAKNKAKYDFNVAITPAVVVKMADIIDAYTFIKMNAVDRHGDEVILYTKRAWDAMVGGSTPRVARAIARVTADILTGELKIE
jgi:hypothetical protein